MRLINQNAAELAAGRKRKFG